MSMETIYADSLFALNFIIDYFLLLCSAKVAGSVIRRGRLALSAALGGAYAVIALLPGAGFLSLAATKLSLALLMSLIAFGGEEKLLRCFIIFLAVSAAFGGAVWGASMLSGGGYDGRLYVPVSLRVLAVSFAVCWALITLAFRRVGRTAERDIVMLTISLGGKTAALRALRDTGNGLFDPISGRAAAVAEAAALSPLFPPPALEALSRKDAAEAMTTLSALPGLPCRFTLIPYRAVGNSGSLLLSFRPEGAAVNGKSVDIIIAVSPAALTGDGTYSAII